MKNAFQMAAAAVIVMTMAQGQSLVLEKGKNLPGFPPEINPETANLGAAPGGSPPTKAEEDAVRAMEKITDPAKRMAAVDDFAIRFPKSSLLGPVFASAGQAAEQAKDPRQKRFYYEKAITATPPSDYAMIMVAVDVAQHATAGTPDFDKDLARADQLAHDGIAAVEKREKGPNQKQEDFDALNKDDVASAHLALGMVALDRNDFGQAGKEFLSSFDMAKTPDAANLLRASMAFYKGDMYDQAIAAADRFLKVPGLPPEYQKRAEDIKTASKKSRDQKK